MRCLLLTLLIVTLLFAQPGLTFPPPKVNAPDDGIRDTIAVKTAELRKALVGISDPTLLLYLKAAEYIVRHGEFYGDQAKWTLGVLDDGLKLAAGKAPPLVPGATNVRAYRSDVDGSVQPYAVTLPADYDANKKWPLHVVLHGRDGGLTEVSFIHRHRGKKAAAGVDYIQLDVFGRGNNAYRWAGETDVFEATEAVKKACPIDAQRVVLRGFSMGGAGTWHLGLHHPDRWCVIGPGAGFTTTKGYAGKLALTPVQEKTLHIYDAVDYAENAANVPIVAYSGGDDPQKKAADNIEAALGKLGMKMTHLISPKTGHTTPPAYQKKLAALYKGYADKGRDAKPKSVRFTTYTLRYPMCDWVYINGLEQHYVRAHVDAEQSPTAFAVKTTNVRELFLTFNGPKTTKTVSVTIDGQKLEAVPVLDASVKEEGRVIRTVGLTKRKGKWTAWESLTILIPDLAPRKHSMMTGPIDDAFSFSFLCVRGTGTPWNPTVASYANADLKRFQAEWSRYMRGDLRVKDDVDVTEDDIKNNNLVVFGDPGSNSVLAKKLPDLPLKWTKSKLTWRGKEYDAATHVPALIYPNPQLDSVPRYVVVNSGHTFHADAFQGTNALLYPRLGDHALLKLTDEKPLAADVVEAGLFDESWSFPPEKP